MYICKRMRLCSFLLSKGFKYVRETKDKYNEKYHVWLFKSTPELRLAIEEYYSQTAK